MRDEVLIKRPLGSHGNRVLGKQKSRGANACFGDGERKGGNRGEEGKEADGRGTAEMNAEPGRSDRPHRLHTPVLAHSNRISLFGPDRLSPSQGGPSGQRPCPGASQRLRCAGTHLWSCVASAITPPGSSRSAGGSTGPVCALQMG
ncbi:hypothetical protein EYF80_038865 [Liparis tanakae]|uniref:Uncharacterized protein n=1 Tax=Liparis tanakae TaxID=230148 RepID=A0A4Z2GE32_9TELE|nr:hypothetical protein EYF80_038865 [Liparis tanakae]